MDNLIIPKCFYRISTKALILNEDKKILLVKEDNWLWELPWWWLDFWESPQEGIKRELFEEMWINVVSIKEYPSYFITAKARNKDFRTAAVIYETKIDSSNLDKFTTSDECQEIKFFDKNEIEIIESFPIVKALSKQYNQNNHK